MSGVPGAQERAVVVRVVLPAGLRTLAGLPGEVRVTCAGAPTQRRVLDALEAAHPVLCGTIRDRQSQRRRPFLRFFVGSEDRSHDDPDAPLPAVVSDGAEPFVVLGAIAGG